MKQSTTDARSIKSLLQGAMTDRIDDRLKYKKHCFCFSSTKLQKKRFCFHHIRSSLLAWLVQELPKDESINIWLMECSASLVIFIFSNFLVKKFGKFKYSLYLCRCPF